jgi:hypothetical protein
MRIAVAGLVLLLTACGAGAEAPADVTTIADTVAAQTSSMRSAHVSFESGTTKGEGVYRTAPDLAADFTTTTPDGPTRFIILDKTIYLRSPARDWVRLDAGRANLADAMINQADIGRQLDKMRSAGTVTGTGDEQLDGRQTTRYSIDLDVARLADAERDRVVKASLRELHNQGVTRIPYRLWLDGDNLPVRIVMELPGRTSTVSYARWGEPVEVTAPA